MRQQLWGGPARAAGPHPFPRDAVALVVGLGLFAWAGPGAWPAAALDWIPPRAVTAVLPSATLAPSSTHQLQLVVHARGASANLDWSVSSGGQFALTVTPGAGSLSVPAGGVGTVNLNVTLPDTALGLAAITVTLDHQVGGGRAAEASASVQAATGGRPEIKPVPGTWQAAAGTAGSVSFQLHSLIGASEVVDVITGRSNPDPNNQGMLFAGSAPPATATIPGGGTITVNATTTIASNAYAGNLNAVQLSVTSDGGISNALGHALATTSGSTPMAFFPVGLVPQDGQVAGRDGPAHLASKAAWLVPSGLSGVRVLREVATDSIGAVDANGDGSDDRWIGTIRIPAYAAALDVIPDFVTAASETLDVGVLAAGRAGLMLLDLRVVEDPPFGTWEDFFDVDMNGIDDRILRTIPLSGFATDVAWFRAASGRVVALVADADSGSVPVSAAYNPAAVVAGTGQGVVAIDVGAALDLVGNPPYAAGSLATPGSALDLEVRGGATTDLAVADGSSGVHLYGLTAAGGIPATVTFTPRGSVALSSAWGTPYARDVAWVSNTRDSVYAAVAASAGGVQIVRAPRAGGPAPSLVMIQQTLGPAIGVAGTWTGTLAATLGATGAALLRAPGGAYLDRILPGAPSPYTAPVTLARGAVWSATGDALEVAAHQHGSSSCSAARFERTSGPIPDLLVSDGDRLLALRPGSAAITGVVETRTPPAVATVRLRVAPNPTGSEAAIELQASWLPGMEERAAGGPAIGRARVELFDARGRLVRTLTANGVETPVLRLRWDGRDASGRPVASGRYWLRATHGYGLVAPSVVMGTVLILR